MTGLQRRVSVFIADRGDKARRIEALLATHFGRRPRGLRILDIGCGNGDISEYLSAANEQYAVDVQDRRRPTNRSFEYRLVDSERLPFEEGFFDAVISNHVIEHVPDQPLHLREIRRVLRRGGVAYLATPNRSSPFMRGHAGNTLVLRYARMKPLFEQAGFRVREVSVECLKQPAYLTGPRFLRLVPVWVLRRLRGLYPSHIFLLVPDA